VHTFNVYGFEDDAAYLQSGEKSAAALRSIIKDHGLSLQAKGAVLDWGCATGRVLRWFAREAQEIEFWGVDQEDASIAWAKENLSPPFNFVTGSAYPHLPFPDNKFNFIYGISVFTHLEHFPDLWLMEMRRVMQPGGCAVFTIHDEYTVQYLVKQGRLPWLPADLDLAKINQHEVTIIRGDTWAQTVTFFRSDYIRREWGRYFNVVEIRPYSEGYQSAVVLRKKNES
jgi:ubiquinone/menaquinone biosynthesis C-methylase UbiE